MVPPVGEKNPLLRIISTTTRQIRSLRRELLLPSAARQNAKTQIRIRFSFTGEMGPFGILIRNKLNSGFFTKL
jgi:hypothetical protein